MDADAHSPHDPVSLVRLLRETYVFVHPDQAALQQGCSGEVLADGEQQLEVVLAVMQEQHAAAQVFAGRTANNSFCMV